MYPMFDLISCGELLIDFVPTVSGVTLAEAPAFKKAPGGAPGNVAVGAARLGQRVGFMGQVGDDEFGRLLADTLRADGVDTTGLRFSRAARTALAFVSLRADGEREFMFYRHPSADMLWRPEDVDTAYAGQTRIFHFGSISLISEPSRSATLTAVAAARAGGAIISYDPNLRLPLWPSAEEARAGLLLGWQHGEIIKVSEEELVFLSGSTDDSTETSASLRRERGSTELAEVSVERSVEPLAEVLAEGARRLWHNSLRLLVVTQGPRGSSYFTPSASGHVAGFKAKPVDTTGAGDGFVAGLLSGLLECDLAWNEDDLRRALRLGNAVGALTTQERGAIPALPTRAVVDAFLAGSGV